MHVDEKAIGNSPCKILQVPHQGICWVFDCPGNASLLVFLNVLTANFYKFDWTEKLVVDHADSMWGVPICCSVERSGCGVGCLWPGNKFRKGVRYAHQPLKPFEARNPTCPTHVDETNLAEPTCSVESGDFCHDLPPQCCIQIV